MRGEIRDVDLIKMHSQLLTTQNPAHFSNGFDSILKGHAPCSVFESRCALFGRHRVCRSPAESVAKLAELPMNITPAIRIGTCLNIHLDLQKPLMLRVPECSKPASPALPSVSPGLPGPRPGVADLQRRRRPPCPLGSTHWRGSTRHFPRWAPSRAPQLQAFPQEPLRDPLRNHRVLDWCGQEEPGRFSTWISRSARS